MMVWRWKKDWEVDGMMRSRMGSQWQVGRTGLRRRRSGDVVNKKVAKEHITQSGMEVEQGCDQEKDTDTEKD